MQGCWGHLGQAGLSALPGSFPSPEVRALPHHMPLAGGRGEFAAVVSHLSVLLLVTEFNGLK